MIDFVLYRMYGHRNEGWPEELLYVGVTRNARTRMRDHESKWWWPKVTRIELQRGFESREELLAAEAKEIRSKQPLCNIQGNPLYNWNRKECEDEGHNPPVGAMCESCEDEKFGALNWLDEESVEYRIWYVDHAKHVAPGGGAS